MNTQTTGRPTGRARRGRELLARRRRPRGSSRWWSCPSTCGACRSAPSASSPVRVGAATGRSDLETARGLAERVAIAVERVLLWGESRAAERAATRHAGQLRRLMEAALAVNAPLAEPEVLRVLADHARRVLGADRPPSWLPVSSTPRSDGPGLVEVASPATPGGRPRSRARRQCACDLVAASDRPLRRPAGSTRPPIPSAPASRSAPGARCRSPWLAVPARRRVGATRPGHRGARRAGRSVQHRGRVGHGPAGPDGVGGPENARLYQAVQGNEHRLRAVVESSPLAIAELDLTGDGPVVERRGGHPVRLGRRAPTDVPGGVVAATTRAGVGAGASCGTGRRTARPRWARDLATTGPQRRDCSSCRCRPRRCSTTTGR